MYSKLLTAVLVGLATLPAWAEKADQKKPIEISADAGTLDQLKGVTVWQGNVIVIQGTLRATADQLTVTRDAQGRQTLQGIGRPATFRQKLEARPEYVEGQGSRVDYTSASNQVVLTGNARVKRGADVVTGGVITYNTETEVYQVSGGSVQGPNKGRVTVILQPKDEGQK
ncbi:lipopolysaccharide transport periplasmic protein LptA [Crenobacter cavernae]|uniref:Lipopolysaccharide export system protein LptA n=1 Tax=Crenobacter cavernae TaxID=2290923 RepID=A0ABY0FGW6_9NEIS|nr:lipopolysaccharide transport periplasmic protein LptA [Crenobacter cavernae]RXZ45636.1 lipopolysaccharide transport periplasmic protein LptA [Crenobacter cavernae]